MPPLITSSSQNLVTSLGDRKTQSSNYKIDSLSSMVLSKDFGIANKRRKKRGKMNETASSGDYERKAQNQGGDDVYDVRRSISSSM